MIIDFFVWVLKMHFAAYFIVRNWAYSKNRALGRFVAIVWGIFFVLHDWATNWLLALKFDEPADEFNLVTDRLHRYKSLPKTDERKIWADIQGAFTNKYDPGHY